jgi:serine/threonine protein kinase
VKVAQKRFGKFRELEYLAAGGMAELFRASDPERDAPIALKRVRRSLAEDPTFVNMLIDEARIAQRLVHPNIVRSFEAGELDGEYYLTMELLEGVSWARMLERGNVSPEAHIRVILDVLAALEYAHDVKDYDGTPLNLVHRDVSPQNVFVCTNGNVKLLDFGIAKATRRIVETTTGNVKGKVRYMSPEQACGTALDARSDLFAVGVMLWEACSRARYWSDDSDIDILRRILTRKLPESASKLSSDVSKELSDVLDTALKYERDERYKSATDFRVALLHAAFRGKATTAARAELARHAGALRVPAPRRLPDLREPTVASDETTVDQNPSGDFSAPEHVEPAREQASQSNVDSQQANAKAVVNAHEHGEVAGAPAKARTISAPEKILNPESLELPTAGTRRRRLASPLVAVVAVAILTVIVAVWMTRTPEVATPSPESTPLAPSIAALDRLRPATSTSVPIASGAPQSPTAYPVRPEPQPAKTPLPKPRPNVAPSLKLDTRDPWQR